MSEIRLNKPLYNESWPPSSSGSSKEGGSQEPAPRPARPPLWMRGASLAIDLLLLHGLALLVLKLAFQPVVGFGVLGPFLGLAVGTLYLAAGYSPLTEGRTVGKLMMRLQTADARAGADLPAGRALLRALLMTWPLGAYAAVSLQVERMADPEKLAPGPILLQMAGFAVAGAWYIGNLFHAWFDPYGRSLVDRLSGSVTVSMEAPAEDLQNYLRAVRTEPDPPGSGRARTALLAASLTVLGLDLMLSWYWTNQFRQLPAKERDLALEQRRAFAVTGFPLPVEMPLEKDPAADRQTTGPQGVQFQYRRRAPLTADQVKANPSALTALDRITSAVTRSIRESVPAEAARQAAASEQGRKMPAGEAKIQVSFAQYGDLFFASQAANVYSEARLLDLEAIRQEVLGTTGTATQP